MALFTPTEASGSTISRCDAIFSDTGMTQHEYYVFGVIDADGLYYDWKDFTLPGGSDNPTIKTAIYDYLIASVNKRVPTTQTSSSDESIIGDNP